MRCPNLYRAVYGLAALLLFLNGCRLATAVAPSLERPFQRSRVQLQAPIIDARESMSGFSIALPKGRSFDPHARITLRAYDDKGSSIWAGSTCADYGHLQLGQGFQIKPSDDGNAVVARLDRYRLRVWIQYRLDQRSGPAGIVRGFVGGRSFVVPIGALEESRVPIKTCVGIDEGCVVKPCEQIESGAQP